MIFFKDKYAFWGILISANIMMYLCTIVISHYWSKIHKHKTLKLTKRHFYNSLMVVLVNILVAIPGYLLFVNGAITFNTTSYFVRDFLLLFFIFDFVMYLLHLISHYVWPFYQFHGKHHAHEYFNEISLYVMEPVESVLFGLILTCFTFLFTFNINSFLVFLAFNWMFGVIGHLNTTSRKQPLLFGNHVFHKTHHQEVYRNFGFYTVIWDRIFGTFHKEDK